MDSIKAAAAAKRRKAETTTDRELRLYRSRRRAAIARAERWANSLMHRILDAGHAIHGDWLVDRYHEEKSRQLAELERREARRRKGQA